MNAAANRRPMVIAHRGASEDAPEHTLAAYRRAIEDGADGLEADVRLTADGHLVCVHDRRVDRTSNGKGVAVHPGVGRPGVARLWLVEARRRRPRCARPLEADMRRVLTLEALLEFVVDSPRPIELAIETKHPTRYAGLVERRLIETLSKFGLAARDPDSQGGVRVMSFSDVALRRVEAACTWSPHGVVDGPRPSELPARRHASWHCHCWTFHRNRSCPSTFCFSASCARNQSLRLDR